jgi:predicted nuclease of restriction endonuclease-like (RecB) superfamily
MKFPPPALSIQGKRRNPSPHEDLFVKIATGAFITLTSPLWIPLWILLLPVRHRRERRKREEAFVQKRQPGIRGFSPQNIWRMRQFFETYRDQPILSPLLRELPWFSNLHILSRSKRPEEREFYLQMASRNHWQVREVARQMDAALFDRSVLHPPKLSNVTPMLATSYSPQRLRRNPAIMSKKCFLNRKPNPKWRLIFILKANCRLLIINN